MIQSRSRARWAPGLLAGPGVAFMILVFVTPVVVLAASSFLDSGKQLTLAHYWRFFSEPQYFSTLWNSLRLAFFTTIIAILLAYPLAYAMATFSSGWRNTILIVTILPLTISVVIRSFGWQILLRNGGPINQSLTALGLIDEPLRLLFSETGVVIGLVHVYLPFMVLPLASAIERIDSRLEEAAMMLGASAFRRFIHVVLPLSVPGLAAGATLVFTASISAYVTPALLGGEFIQVMPTMVAQQVLTLMDWSFGSAVSMILTVVSLFVLVIHWATAARFTNWASRAEVVK
jgi:putative spermidine/putrescine transport system permease protein